MIPLRVRTLSTPSTRRARRALAFAAGLALGACALVEGEDEGPPVTDGGAVERDGMAPECGAPTDCADENPCTDDRCTDGRCAHTPLEAGSPCRDNDVCNGDEACDATGVCQPGTPKVCEPSNACSTAACEPESGTCVETPVADCCLDDRACARPGESACTATRCNPETRTCQPVAVPGCCETDADCPDEICADVRCNPDKHTCERAAVPGCCTVDAQCPGEACVTGACDPETHACASAPVADCCLHDGDCPPPPACSVSACDLGQNRCVTSRIDGCCADDRDCGPGRTCDLAAGACVNQPVECCAADADCGPPVGCFVPTCAGGEACCTLERLPDCCAGDFDCPPGMRCNVERAACEESPVQYAATQWPVAPITRCEGDETPLLFGRVFVDGRTPGPGQGAFVDAEVGYGPEGVSPDDPAWTFVPALYNGDLVNGFGELNDDEYLATFVTPAAGTWEVAWRFRVNDSAWVYGDLVPDGNTDGYTSDTALRLISEDCARLVIGYAAFQHPLEPVELCPDEAAPLIFGRVYVAERTPGAGQGRDVLASLGYGPAGTSPDDAGWTWIEGTYNSDLRNALGELGDDEYRGELGALPPGEWALAWRFHSPGGVPVLGDLPPQGSLDGFDPSTTLVVRVAERCP